MAEDTTGGEATESAQDQSVAVDSGPDADLSFSEEGGGEEQAKSDEPFLKVDDRTVYKDRESAVKGWQDTKGHLDRYRTLGDPEQIQQKLAQSEAVSKALAAIVGGNGTAEQKRTALEALPEETREQWMKTTPILKELIGKDYVSQESWQAHQQHQFDLRAQLALQDQASDRGLDLSEVQVQRMRDMAMGAMDRYANGDRTDPLAEKLMRAYNAGDSDRFAKFVLNDVHGERGKRQARNDKGQYANDQERREAAAASEAAADKAAQLPKPTGTGTAGVPGTSEEVAKTPWAKRGKLLRERLAAGFRGEA